MKTVGENTRNELCLLLAFFLSATGCKQSNETRLFDDMVESTKAHYDATEIRNTLSPIFEAYKSVAIELPSSQIPRKILELPLFQMEKGGVENAWWQFSSNHTIVPVLDIDFMDTLRLMGNYVNDGAEAATGTRRCDLRCPQPWSPARRHVQEDEDAAASRTPWVGRWARPAGHLPAMKSSKTVICSYQ